MVLHLASQGDGPPGLNDPNRQRKRVTLEVPTQTEEEEDGDCVEAFVRMA